MVGLNSLIFTISRRLKRSNSRCLQLVINQPPGHSSSSSSHEASGTDSGDEIRHQHCWSVTFIQGCRTSACLPLSPCSPSVIFPAPCNRPTLLICLDSSTHIARLAVVYSGVCSVAQAACTAPESCLSRHLSGRPGFASVVSRRIVLRYEACVHLIQ